MSARPKSAKRSGRARLPLVTPEPNGCASSVRATVSTAPGRAAKDLLEYSEELMRAFLLHVPPGKYRAKTFSITTASPTSR